MLTQQAHAAEIRARLRNPPNARPDFGIDLRNPNREIEERARLAAEAAERRRRFDDACLDFFNWQATPEPPEPRRLPRGNHPTFGKILIEACKHFGVSMMDVKSPRRFHRFVLTRQVIYWLARELTILSYPQMGRMIGRDHTTIIFGVRKIDNLRARDPKLQKSLDHLLSVLRSHEPENCNAELSEHGGI